VSALCADRERAAAFVARHGDALARARAAALVGSAPASEALVQLDLARPACEDEALELTLRVCDELGARGDARVERACIALASRQAPDGGFCAEVEDLDRRLQRTGMLAGYLAKTPFARPALLDAAGDFLALYFSPERVQGFQWDNLTAYAHYFANALHERADEVLQWCGRELERGIRAGALDAVRALRILAWCDAHSLPGARLSREELLSGLAAEQAADGGFGVPVAPAEERVGATLDALVALRHLRV
jgi:hypothetical protein